ncbi:hypothetical protein O3P69_006227 [Scylla paramamosain]|uniref:Alpha 1,4-glycosyltransferase domain-containing protein n=1 Tax=Scylla paramamosain TaxID=85552 RepID=A0AAW0U9F2_SCYPA
MRRRRWWKSVFIIVVTVIILSCITFPSSTRTTTDREPWPPKPKPLERSSVSEEVHKDTSWWQFFLCNLKQHHIAEEASNAHRLHILHRDTAPSHKNTNVFLIDTACNSRPKFRAWCSIESWAQVNPSLQIWFVMTSATISDFEGFPSKLLQKYSNLNIVGADVEKMVEDTPLKQLFDSKKWTQNNTWPVELLSDMMRVLVLWRWGGIYSDTDVVSIRPFDLPLNSLGYETDFQIGSAVYSFEAQQSVMWRLMKDMVNGFMPELWGSIGPKAITRVVKAMCGVEDLQTLLPKTPVICGGVTLHPRQTFYPVDYTQSKKFFTKNRGIRFEKTFRHSHAIHFWNKMSKELMVTKGDNSLYEVAAKKYCPITYSEATQEADTF